MSEWITEEEGKVRQEKTWASLTNLLNKIQPGCLDWCPPAKGL